MKKLTSFIVLILIGLLGASCESISSPIQGVLFTNTSQHLYDRSSGNTISSSADIVKSGEACSFSSSFLYIYLFFYGASDGIDEAMKNGNIKKVAVVDHRSTNILGALFYQECTVVYGE